MKTNRQIIIFLIGVTAMNGCASSSSTRSASSHPFRLVDVEHPEPHRNKGVFTFTSTTGKPLRVFGFDYPDDGEFQIRYTKFQFQTPRGWRDLRVIHCGGSGEQDFILQPGRTYQIREWLDPYELLSYQTGGATIGRISLPTFKGYPEIWSEPFKLPTRR